MQGDCNTKDKQLTYTERRLIEWLAQLSHCQIAQLLNKSLRRQTMNFIWGKVHLKIKTKYPVLHA
ncbi:helix-turn-helix domain-containing protein [Lactovum miscens]|uniref:Uncharacterized protein n=1 Tax=Lactovum miscens TaxID=190387 RepID=A0A841C7Q3_9LACT|nr:helix-turn-helix domain-containing protein [Lactovum miscens]MBB5888515.1 hypothetical protein [Lactovum miscens]